MQNFSFQHFKDVSFERPAENILYDEVLLKSAEEGTLSDTLRLWESPVYFVVLGRTGKEGEDLNKKTILSDQIPVLRRSSGGGTVVQGKGCLNFTFILSKEKYAELNDLRRSYVLILEGVLTLLKDLGVSAGFKLISDLALVNGEKKFSGNAQKRGKKFILHHGTILYDFDLSLIPKYLAMPKDIPEYRQGRAHEKFVTNLNLTAPVLRQGFKTAFLSKNSLLSSKPDAQELKVLQEFVLSRPPEIKI